MKNFTLSLLFLLTIASPLTAWPMERVGENGEGESWQRASLATQERADLARTSDGQGDQSASIARDTAPVAISENDPIVTDDEGIEPNTLQSSTKNFSLAFMEGGYLFPLRGGITYNGRRYTEHALERMAPETPEIVEELQRRVEQRAKAEGLTPDTDEYNTWLIKHAPQPRGVLPDEVEAELENPGTTDLKVITSEEGDVITVIKKKQRRVKQVMDCLNRILIKKRKIQLEQKPTIDSNFFSLAQTMVGKQLLTSVRKQREKVASDFSSCEDRKSFYERMNSQLKQVFNEIREKQAARKLKMRHALQDVQRTFQRITKVNRDGLLDNWKWPVKAIKEKFHQAAVKLDSSQLLQIVLENFKKRQGKIFQQIKSIVRVRSIVSNHSDASKKISDHLSLEKKQAAVIEAAQAAKKEARSAAEISAWDHVLVVSKAADDCSMEAAKMRGAGYDDELAAQWLEAARKYERTARESTQAATAYAAGNVNEGKSWVVASWQTHESADRAANKARVAQLDVPSSHETQAPPAIISKEKEISEFEPAFVQEKEGVAQELPSSKIDKADKKRIRASKKLEATALSYAAIWSQTASDYSVKEVAARSADNEKLAARWFEASENSRKVAEEYTKAAQLYAEGKINEGAESWHDARFTSNAVKRAADSAAALQREEKIKPSSFTSNAVKGAADSAVAFQREEKIEHSSDTAVIFPKTISEYCLKLQEAEAANNSELIAKWREVVDKSQQGEELHRRAAAIYATGNKKEARPLFASARAAEKEASLIATGTTFAAKLKEVQLAGDATLTNHWGKVVQQWHLAERDSAATQAAANKEESSLWMNAANSGRRTAHTAAKQIDCLMKQHKALIAGYKMASILWGEAAEKNQKASEASQQAAEIWRAPKKGSEKWREQSRKKKGESADNIAQSMEKEANTAFKNAISAEAKEKYGVQVEVGRIEEKTWIPNLKSSSKAGGSSQKLSSASQAQVDPVDKSSKKKVNSAKKKTAAVPVAKTKKEKAIEK